MTEAISLKGLTIGRQASVKKIFTATDLVEYKALTRDTGLNFGAEVEQPTVPGPLLGGMISYLLGTQLPGPGTNWLKQRYRFLVPAYLDQEITATVEITRLRPEKDLVNLRVTCTNPIGETVCEGESLVLVKDLVQR